MQPEIIVNLWPYIQRCVIPDGQFDLIYQLGVRLYAASGTDDHKLALLGRLAPWEHNLAPVFPIPQSRKVHLGLDPRNPTLSGVIALQTVAGPGEQGALLGEVIDAVRRPLPENPVTAAFKRTPFEDLSVLYLSTPLHVDDDGNVTADLRMRNAEALRHAPQEAINLWAFPGRDSRSIKAIAGRTYLVAGDRAVAQGVIDDLAAADYLLLNRFSPPAALSTDTVATVVEQEHAVFSEVVSEIEKDIPVKSIDRDRKRMHRYDLLPTNLSIRKVTVISGVNGEASRRAWFGR